MKLKLSNAMLHDLEDEYKCFCLKFKELYSKNKQINNK